MKRQNMLVVLMVASLLAGVLVFSPPVAWTQEESPWKDRAEYDAFNAMVQATDPNQRIQLAEKYLGEYPETKFRDKVYEFQLQAYQQLNNTQKVEETAGKLLEVNANHFPALYMLSYLIPRTVQGAGGPEMDAKLNHAADYAQRGLDQLASLPKPEGISDADFQKQKEQSEATFHQTLGFVSLQKKDYELSAQQLRKSVELNPNEALAFYWLGLAYLTPKPPNYEEGIWAMARAVSITGQNALPAATITQVKDYVTSVYKNKRLPQTPVDENVAKELNEKATQELNDIMAQAATSAFPRAGFRIEEMTVEAEPEPEPEPVRELTVKPEELTTFDVIVAYLSGGGVKAEDTWTLLHGASLPMPGKVVQATPQAKPTTIFLAVSPEVAQAEGKHDVEVTLAAPLARPLEVGQTIQFDGVVDSYQPKPFVLRFKDGKIVSR